MKTDTIFDIVTLIITFAYVVTCIILMTFISKYKENEFNRLWRTRIFLVVLTLLQALVSGLTNLKWYPRQFNNVKNKAASCTISTYLHQMVIFPLFLGIITHLLQCASNAKLIKDNRPNLKVIRKSFFYAVFPIVAGIVNLVLAGFRHDIVFFISYDENEATCVESSYYQVIQIVFIIALLIILIRSNKKVNSTVLNVHHQKRVKQIPFLYIPFIIVCALTLAEPYVGKEVQIAFRFIDYILTTFFMFILLHFLVIRPIKDASKSPLTRGHITKRHGIIESPINEEAYDDENLADEENTNSADDLDNLSV
ncbi:hypothetical protein TRFO_07283 [Tritrichomonas foetus]|uniref:Uncharacterized protein n=1 Tax=Tritrichomonas foetus TaxID=1144522 RepID=A0A1J4JX31_9EUKA|nr:hypothetical protein TRFO_07283 [Tritrichomonas foetus]|eukprot:OHT02094.1 hypothetical protein TRFO_07283 [Tritrichomonas foetus]